MLESHHFEFGVNSTLKYVKDGCLKNTGTTRFLTYYVHVTKCISDTKYMENPNQSVSNIVLRHEGIPHDTL